MRVVDQLLAAWNAHDPVAVSALFAPDYRSLQPNHPSAGFIGRDQVLKNWTAVFAGVPDFTAELVASCAGTDGEWAEWQWTGRHTDGAIFLMRGVTILVPRDGLIAEGRLYLERVDVAGEGIDSEVRDLYKPPE